jgi:hypothetical protein
MLMMVCKLTRTSKSERFCGQHTTALKHGFFLFVCFTILCHINAMMFCYVDFACAG